MKKRQRKEAITSHIPYGPYEAYVKRPMDIVLSVTALLFLWPLMGVTAALVKKKLGSPVLFSQERPGRDGKIFCLYKFRTMTDEKDSGGQLLSDEVRLTSFGKRLRSSSLDELPEILNIIKGDISDFNRIDNTSDTNQSLIHHYFIPFNAVISNPHPLG